MAIVKLSFSQGLVKVYNSVTATYTTITLTSTVLVTPQIINVNIGDSVFLVNSVTYSIKNKSTNVWLTINDIDYNLSHLNNSTNHSIIANDLTTYQFYGNSIQPLYFQLVQNIATSIADLKLNTFKLTVFPNPVIDEVNVSFAAKKEKMPIEVFDIQGRLILSEESERIVGVNKVSVDVSNLNAGFYYIRAGSEVVRIVK